MRRTDGSNEFDPRAIFRSRCERRIASQQQCSKCFGESDVRGVVRGDIMTKFPDPEQKEIMRASGQRKIDKILERLEPPNRIKFTGPRIPAQGLRDFDIEGMGRMNGFVWVKKPFGHLSSGRSIQQHLDDNRGINNNHRSSRSALTALAGETVGVKEDRWARRFLNSPIVGRSATRRTS